MKIEKIYRKRLITLRNYRRTVMDDLQTQILRKEVVEKLKDFASQVGSKLAEQQDLIGKVVKAFEALDARITLLEKPKDTEVPEDRDGKEL